MPSSNSNGCTRHESDRFKTEAETEQDKRYHDGERNRWLAAYYDTTNLSLGNIFNTKVMVTGTGIFL